MNIKTAIRVMEMLDGEHDMYSIFRELMDEGVIDLTKPWLADAALVAVKCMNQVLMMEDDLK